MKLFSKFSAIIFEIFLKLFKNFDNISRNISQSLHKFFSIFSETIFSKQYSKHILWNSFNIFRNGTSRKYPKFFKMIFEHCRYNFQNDFMKKFSKFLKYFSRISSVFLETFWNISRNFPNFSMIFVNNYLKFPEYPKIFF